jgi:hypothetical protein
MLMKILLRNPDGTATATKQTKDDQPTGKDPVGVQESGSHQPAVRRIQRGVVIRFPWPPHVYEHAASEDVHSS